MHVVVVHICTLARGDVNINKCNIAHERMTLGERRREVYPETTVHMRLVAYHIYNKRAQRALGRSPDEKVKGHSGAIYRGPLMLSTKYW